ncbi:hypothetical protein IQ265_11480 [Nodosilinea sp. LEGE 06152]|uniref:hypothetical protein n=1 Tax=Nodosilinea sp. LEGE 06152 TaxID=2777966 RepID=UPI00188209A1|nr:hypothetical protein [Nodosilinea sp. LEGE 06152]MBE9157440.1 hypothetical protein [Nodosilinea sp. LEGE 06152]
MASSPLRSNQPATLTWGNHIRTNLCRLATAAAAVIGLSAMASGASGSTPGLPDGTYLYGESPVANTVGSVYFVFEAREGRLSGALYQPSSSFDCVRGTVANGALNLVITDAYDQSESPYSVALVGDAAVASTSGGSAPAQLEGMYAIATLSELDQQLLAACNPS